MAIKVIVDSGCDLPDEVIHDLNIDMVPLQITFENGATYLDRYELNNELFTAKLHFFNSLPKTAAPDPVTMMASFEKGLAEEGQVLFISLASNLSRTYETAHLVRNMMETDKVEIFDSLSASLGTGLMAVKAVHMARQGLSISAIVAELTLIRAARIMFFTLDTLDNLVKGGRLKKHAGLYGNLMQIKPIMRMDNQGNIEVIEKIRGRKKSVQRLLEMVEENAGDSLTDKLIGISHFNCLEEAQQLAAALKTRYQLQQDIIISEIGATIGTYTGEGGILITF